MARVCHSCGKGPSFGHSRSHSMVATKRRFDPNLQKVRIVEKGAKQRALVGESMVGAVLLDGPVAGNR